MNIAQKPSLVSPGLVGESPEVQALLTSSHLQPTEALQSAMEVILEQVHVSLLRTSRAPTSDSKKKKCLIFMIINNEDLASKDFDMNERNEENKKEKATNFSLKSLLGAKNRSRELSHYY